MIETLLNTAFYAGLTFLTSFPLIFLVCLVDGLGRALKAPALSTFYLDITAEQHKSRVVGIMESSVSLGGVVVRATTVRAAHKVA